jgi:hypothetical protein
MVTSDAADWWNALRTAAAEGKREPTGSDAHNRAEFTRREIREIAGRKGMKSGNSQPPFSESWSARGSQQSRGIVIRRVRVAGTGTAVI